MERDWGAVAGDGAEEMADLLVADRSGGARRLGLQEAGRGQHRQLQQFSGWQDRATAGRRRKAGDKRSPCADKASNIITPP